jgi:integrase
VLLALRRTGCRPKELRSLTWDQVNLDEGLWVIPKHKTVTMQRVPRPRIIPLPPDIWKLCRWLKARAVAGTTHVFLNTYGNAEGTDKQARPNQAATATLERHLRRRKAGAAGSQ